MGSKSPTVQTSSNSSTAVAPYVSEAQQGLLNYGSSQLGGFLGSNPNYAIAGFNPDQTAAFDLTRNLSQDAFTNTGGTGATQTALSQAPNYTTLNPTPGLMNFQQQMGMWQAPTAATQATAAQAGAAQTYTPTMATAAQLDPSAYKAFLNPYVNDVVDTTTANMRRQYQQSQADLGASSAASGAFGGSRQAIQSAQLDRSFGEQVASTTASLMAAGFDKATASAMANAQMQQQTNLANASAQNQSGQFGANANNNLSQFNAGLMSQANQFNAGAQNTRDNFNAGQGASQLQSFNSNQLQAYQQQQNAAVQMGQLQEAIRQGDTSRQVQALQMLAAMGVTQQQLAQSAINVPTAALQQYAKIVPTQVPTTTATTGTQPNTAPSLTQQLLGIGGTLGAAALCDARFKKDISYLGTGLNGRPLFAFRYKGENDDAPLTIGPMAQIEEAHNPDSVVEALGVKLIKVA